MVFWALVLTTVAIGGLLLWRLATHRRWRRWERARRRELEAYCTLEMTLPMHGDPRKRTERAKRVARLVTDRSVFARSAVFLPDEAGRLICVGSCGMNDVSLGTLDAWCERCLLEESAAPQHGKERLSVAVRRSFTVPMASMEESGGLASGVCTTATMIPIRLQRGRLVGLLTVCGSRVRRLSVERSEEAVAPLELLAAKLARTLERAMLMDRLIQVERLAGAAQLAAGVAESLVGPMRRVLDRAELIVGTTNETRVREHSQAIAAEAEQMTQTLGVLREAWRPREEAGTVVTKGQR